MRLRSFLVALLMLVAGWWLGWYAHDRFGADPEYVFIRDRFPASPAVIPERSLPETARSAYGHAGTLAVMLDRHDFGGVMERYAELQMESGEAAITARDAILATARALVDAQHYMLAEDLLQQFLVLELRDVDAHMLLAEAYHGQGDDRAAIDQLYEAKGHAYRPLMLQRISARIRAYVVERVESLKAGGDHAALLALYQYLVQQEPDHAPYFLGLAGTQFELDDLEAARRSLSLVVQDAVVGAQAQTLLAEINLALAGMQGIESGEEAAAVVGIPLQRSGNHFIVTGRPVGTHNVQLLIDTGASLTIFTPAVFERRGIRYQDTGRTRVFQTANGSVRAPVYRIAALAIGDWQVNELDIGVLDLGRDATIDGLLGMNFLSHFQFFLDQNKSVLMLTTK
jgi:clan AA aspartic protease (TIGR02281 family)